MGNFKVSNVLNMLQNFSENDKKKESTIKHRIKK